METQDWNPKEHGYNDPKALLIGHDPRLKESKTLAEFALFANYYFDKTIKDSAKIKKLEFASSAFNQIVDITNGKISPEEIYVTNLCNVALPATKGTVYITKELAVSGIENIKRILKNNPSIEYIFPMSVQVNYWLQKLGFYTTNDEYVDKSEPKIEGVHSIPPYFDLKKNETFLIICGNRYLVKDGNQIVIPILHTKSYSNKNILRAYESAYKRIRSYFN